jgi:hypothetical protein
VRIFALSMFVVAVAACGDSEHHVPNLLEHHNRHFISKGTTYVFEFAEAIDQHPVNRMWPGDNLLDSPLAFMGRIPIVIKTDDYGGALNANAARFIETVDAFGGFASLGIITSTLTDRKKVNSTYFDLHRRGFEAWFHGHSHDYSLPEAEFSGASQKKQEDSFKRGIELGREVLDIEFHSFGAPGNAIDESTGPALSSFPQIVVWLFGIADSPALSGTDVFVLPRVINIEQAVHEIMPPEDFLTALDNLLARAEQPEVLTLQVHPNGFGAADFDRTEAILADVQQRNLFRYTAPYGFWKWQQDAHNLALTKTSPTTYTLDLTAADFDHILEFDPDGPMPTTFAEN